LFFWQYFSESTISLFPELVVTGDNGYKLVNYTHLVPVLIEAIKELSLLVMFHILKVLENLELERLLID